LVYVKIPVGKGCGFVQFTHRWGLTDCLSFMRIFRVEQTETSILHQFDLHVLIENVNMW
jgi:hypothetical protein